MRGRCAGPTTPARERLRFDSPAGSGRIQSQPTCIHRIRDRGAGPTVGIHAVQWKNQGSQNRALGIRLPPIPTQRAARRAHAHCIVPGGVGCAPVGRRHEVTSYSIRLPTRSPPCLQAIGHALQRETFLGSVATRAATSTWRAGTAESSIQCGPVVQAFFC